MKKKSTKKKTFWTSDNILKLVFYILLVIVVILGIIVFIESKKENKKELANIVVPVQTKGTQSTITINADNLSKDYIIKVTNYRNNKINSKKLQYDVNVINNTSTNIKVTKNSSSNNLMVDNKNTIVKGENLKSTIKEDVYYHISLDDDNVKNKETIVVRITS